MPRGRDGLRPQGHWRAGRDVCGRAGGAFELISTATLRPGEYASRRRACGPGYRKPVEVDVADEFKLDVYHALLLRHELARKAI